MNKVNVLKQKLYDNIPLDGGESKVLKEKG